MRPSHIRQALLIALAILPCAAPLTPAVHAQGTDIAGRFTFVAPKAPKSLVDGDRLLLSLNRWSTDAERDNVFRGVTEHGANTVLDALREVGNIGYLRWPGGTGVRRSLRTPRFATRWRVRHHPHRRSPAVGMVGFVGVHEPHRAILGRAASPGQGRGW